MELFLDLSDSLCDQLEIKKLLISDREAFVSYFADVFEKFNMSNKKLHWTNKSLLDAKAKIFDFVALM